MKEKEDMTYIKKKSGKRNEHEFEIFNSLNIIIKEKNKFGDCQSYYIILQYYIYYLFFFQLNANKESFNLKFHI